MNMAKGARLVTAIGFSPSGKWIAATDAAEKIEVHLFERGKGGKAKFTCEVGKKCVNLSWMSGDDVMFGVAGAKHLSFFAIEIFVVDAKNVQIDPDLDLKKVARGTPGFSGAELANLINEAALLAARLGKNEITIVEMEEARDKIRKHVKNTYLKRVDAPINAPKPLLTCWLELNYG